MHRMPRSAQGRGPIFVLKMWGFFSPIFISFHVIFILQDPHPSFPA